MSQLIKDTSAWQLTRIVPTASTPCLAGRKFSLYNKGSTEQSATGRVLYVKMSMKSLKYLLIIFLLTGAIPFGSVKGQNIIYIRVADLEKILNDPENKLLVINFWASWCPPCVKELPGFQKAAGKFEGSKVKFIMVSLDFPDEVQSKLIPFLEKNNIVLNISVMLDTDYTLWESKVDRNWKGDIPSSLFLNNSRKIRYFHPGELSEDELNNLINKFI
ncbi:MAG: TlpA disulfide reductase family protein [Bacteroidales bacterium]